VKAKPKNPSTQSGKTDKPSHEKEAEARISSAQESADDGSDTMSADEMAVFDQIMGEIEGREDGKADPSVQPEQPDESDELDEEQQKAFESIMAQIEGGDAPAEEDGSPEPLTNEPEPADDFAAQVEKVAKEADTAAVEQPDESGDGPDELDEEQQKAFESIMAQIEGGDAPAEEDETPEPPTDEPEPADDFAAQLEKVAKEAAAASAGQPDESDDAPEELDEEQQKAYESIMAQIEGGDAPTDEDGTPEPPTDEPEPVDDFTAQLEKVAKEADAAAVEPPDESDDGPDELDEEQQKAYESIMAQIEGGDQATDEERSAEPPHEELEKVAKGADAATADGAANAGGDSAAQDESASPQDEADADSEEISEGTEDVLRKITENGDESTLPASEDETESEPRRATEAPEAGDEEGPTVTEAQSGNADLKDGHSSPADDPGKDRSLASTVRPSLDAPPVDKPPDKKPRPKVSSSPKKAKRQRKAPPSATGRKKKQVMASVLAVFVLALAGYFYWPHKGGSAVVKTPDTGRKILRPGRNAPTATAAPPPPNPAAVPQAPSDIQRLKTTAEKLDGLRGEMVAKQEEIQKLSDYYQDGINAEIQGIVDKLQRTGQGTVDLENALADARINLGLSAIQRRDGYLRKLKAPIDELRREGEALRFYSRKAGVLALMAAKTGDIDVDGFIRQADEIMKAYRQNLIQLSIDPAASPPTALETIWKDIERRLSTHAATVNTNSDNRTDVTLEDNARIWKQICEGDVSEKYKLTALSPEAAHCLAAWKGKDLYLDNLTDLSPQAAHALAAWKGQWLGLNGLTNLSPETARQLSRWKGQGLSLNGLPRLSPKVVAMLSEWQGDQIELINVKAMPPWKNPKTRLFLSEALKRKLGYTRN
jgi:hypothetical protein